MPVENTWTPRLRELEGYARIMVERTTQNADCSMGLVLVDRDSSIWEHVVSQDAEVFAEERFAFLVVDRAGFELIAKMNGEPSGIGEADEVPVLLAADGRFLGTSMVHRRAAGVESKIGPHPAAKIRVNAKGEYELSPLAVLITYYRSPLKDFKPGVGRERAKKFKQRVDSLYALESIRPEPRTIEEVMRVGFGVAFEADLRAKGIDFALERLFRLRCPDERGA